MATKRAGAAIASSATTLNSLSPNPPSSQPQCLHHSLKTQIKDPKPMPTDSTNHKPGARFREGVGVLPINQKGEVLLCKRVDRGFWQFPQGGMDAHDRHLHDTLAREVYEELGLAGGSYEVLGRSKHQHSYLFPPGVKSDYLGQSHYWFLIQLHEDALIDLSGKDGEKAEFSAYKWVSYYYPITESTKSPKHQIYRHILTEFAPLVATSLSLR